jgi:hypothetical protein
LTNTTVRLRAAVRGALVLGIFVSGHAASGCGSEDSFIPSIPGVGGIGGFGSGGLPGSGGGVGTGGTITGSGGSIGATGGTVTGQGGSVTGTGGASGGVPGTGSVPGSGGGLLPDGGGNPDSSVGSGGAAPVADGGCREPTSLLNISNLPNCALPSLPLCTAGMAKCFPKNLAEATVPAEALAQLADCDATNKCIPSFILERLGKFNAKVCTSLKGAEGRCLSVCIPEIAGQASFLPKADCGDGELCAPCFDPRTGENSSACNQGCDLGPTKDPVVFGKCCGNQGSCVPKSAVPASDQTQLGKDTCTDANDLCAPNKLSAPGYKPLACTSIGGSEGRCLADCIPQVASQASRLKRDVCDAGELCAPCTDPLTGASTGACTRNGDAPTKPPFTFSPCCGTLGHCVPGDILSTEQKALLGPDTCTGTNLCAPDILATPGSKPPACRSLGSANAEGRCLPACLPSVAARASQLSQGTCSTGNLCAPCYDPITGATTGACDQNGDAPAEPKKVFPTCCGGDGLCIPTPLVPAAQRPQLGKDVCTASDNLCAPKAFTDASVKPTACTAPGGVEARCLPACLPALQARKDNLRQVTCKATELCAPCYDPITGADTGACTVNGDAPVQPKKVFPGCCPRNSVNRATCVPAELLSQAQQDAAPQLTCAANNECVPNLKANNPSAKFPTCTAGIFGAGACVPDCIPSDAQKLFLSQGTCVAGELCAPCSLFGASTGSCD